MDRDGVLNANVFYPDTGAWEAPRAANEFVPLPGVAEALQRLHRAGYLLFVVSNQPNVVKGKCSPEAFASMQEQLIQVFREADVPLVAALYCMHHPEFSGPCLCRKPSPYFLQCAAKEHAVLLRESWMVGDRSTDMQCGRNAGARTAWMRTGQEAEEPASSLYDIVSHSLCTAVEQILDDPAQGREAGAQPSAATAAETA